MRIVGCGAIEEEKEIVTQSDNGVLAEDEAAAVPRSYTSANNQTLSNYSAVPPPSILTLDKPGYDEDTQDIPDPVAPTKHMSEKQRRLFELKLKMNKARNLNRKEVREEHSRLTSRKETENRKDKALAAEKRKREEGLLRGDDYLNVTAEVAGAISLKKSKKENNTQSYGWNVFNQDSLYRAHEKRINQYVLLYVSAFSSYMYESTYPVHIHF